MSPPPGSAPCFPTPPAGWGIPQQPPPCPTAAPAMDIHHPLFPCLFPLLVWELPKGRVSDSSSAPSMAKAQSVFVARTNEGMGLRTKENLCLLAPVLEGTGEKGVGLMQMGQEGPSVGTGAGVFVGVLPFSLGTV